MRDLPVPLFAALPSAGFDPGDVPSAPPSNPHCRCCCAASHSSARAAPFVWCRCSADVTGRIGGCRLLPLQDLAPDQFGPSQSHPLASQEPLPMRFPSFRNSGSSVGRIDAAKHSGDE